MLKEEKSHMIISINTKKWYSVKFNTHSLNKQAKNTISQLRPEWKSFYPKTSVRNLILNGNILVTTKERKENACYNHHNSTL